MRRLDLRARARRITASLSPFASLAGTILALYGVVHLANPAIGLFFKLVAPASVEGSARPICEDFPFYSAEMAHSKHYKLMGADVRAYSAVSRLRLEWTISKRSRHGE